MSKIVNRIAAVAALALAATPIIGLTAAHAAEPVARIPVSDLTLSDPAGAREFARRVNVAGYDACSAQGLRGLTMNACMNAFRAEVKDTISARQATDLKVAQRAGASTELASN